jgi:hypothetical protein
MAFVLQMDFGLWPKFLLLMGSILQARLAVCKIGDRARGRLVEQAIARRELRNEKAAGKYPAARRAQN